MSNPATGNLARVALLCEQRSACEASSPHSRFAKQASNGKQSPAATGGGRYEKKPGRHGGRPLRGKARPRGAAATRESPAATGGRPLRGDIQADVEGGSRVGDGPDSDAFDAGGRDASYGFDGDTT